MKMNGKIQRIPAKMYEEAGEIAEEMRRDPVYGPMVRGPMDVIRVALRRGLDAMKAERAGGAK
ncbi:MAG: hypothetical protein EBZ91_13310 [Gammaproteobacteria bacterium]|nr:hypothetical protein [Gammaproteobacteria bacterium]NDE81627.1 hypothetical protein [Actinomycetota bacterium]